MKRLLILLPLLTGCAAPVNPRLEADCGEDWGRLTVGMSEGRMKWCSFRGYTPYVSSSRVTPQGVLKIYEGMSQVKWVGVADGKVVMWQN